MTEDHWTGVLAQLSPDEPVEIDGALFSAESLDPPPAPDTTATHPLSAKLWERAEPPRSFIGVRVTRQPEQPLAAALRLAAAALERGVEPVILSALDDPGFARFGFRVERLVGHTAEARAACEADLVAFWDIALVIDVEDIAALG